MKMVLSICIPLGRWPNERITTPSSAIVIVPSSSLSKSINASLNSREMIEIIVISGRHCTAVTGMKKWVIDFGNTKHCHEHTPHNSASDQ